MFFLWTLYCRIFITKLSGEQIFLMKSCVESELPLLALDSWANFYVTTHIQDANEKQIKKLLFYSILGLRRYLDPLE